MSYNIKEFLEEGKKKEQEFAECFLKTMGGTIQHASSKDDMYNHVDLYWNNKWGFDVKGMKKTRRHDSEYNDTIHYVEMQNVNGNIGWLYGKSHYFAFETKKSWIIVSKKNLIDFIENIVDYSQILTYTSDFYKQQRRRGRLDIFTKVKTEDLIKISNLIINKDE